MWSRGAQTGIVEWRDALLGDDALVSQAIKILDEVSLRIVLVIDRDKKLVGTITDGDVRRGLVGHVEMSDSVVSIMNKSPITASVDQSRESILSLMRQWDILQVPVIDSNHRIIQVEFLQTLTRKETLENPVMLMAGGFGKRLYPLTADMPKPMLKVGNKPILESIIEQLVESGFNNIYISIYFKGEVVRNHFGNGSAWGVNIEYIEETEPLGTGGAVSLLPKDDNILPILLVNGDILTRVDFRRLLEFHNEQHSHLTICVREYDFQVPYGVVTISDLRVKELTEKPIHQYFVNAGIYVVSNEVVKGIGSRVPMDMPDLVNLQIAKGNHVNAFPIHEYWIDIGLMDQYEKAQTDILRISSDK